MVLGKTIVGFRNYSSLVEIVNVFSVLVLNIIDFASIFITFIYIRLDIFYLIEFVNIDFNNVFKNGFNLYKG